MRVVKLLYVCRCRCSFVVVKFPEVLLTLTCKSLFVMFGYYIFSLWCLCSLTRLSSCINICSWFRSTERNKGIQSRRHVFRWHKCPGLDYLLPRLWTCHWKNGRKGTDSGGFLQCSERRNHENRSDYHVVSKCPLFYLTSPENCPLSIRTRSLLFLNWLTLSRWTLTIKALEY